MEKEIKNMKIINVLDKDSGDVRFNQVRSEEIGTKYILVKGEDDLYEEKVDKTILPDFCNTNPNYRFRPDRIKFPQ